MKIAHVVHSYYPAVGGIETGVQDLCEGLANRGHEVSVVTPFLRGKKVVSQDYRNKTHIVRLPIIQIKSRINFAPNIVDLLREMRPSLIHLHGYGWMLMNDQVAAAFPRTPKILTTHGGEIITAYPRYARPILRIYHILAGRQELSRIDKIVALTTFERRYLIRMGISGGKLAIIPPGIKWEQIEGNGDRFRRKWKLERRPIILCLGRIHPRKGQLILLQAIRKVVSRYPLAIAVFVGATNEYSKELLRLATLRGIGNNVLFTGYLSNEAKLEALAACDIFVSASAWESFGTSILEAMYCGKAIIAPDAGGIPSLIENELSGLLLEDYEPASLASLIMRLLDDGNLRTILGDKAMRRSSTYYTIDRMLDDYESLYGQVLV